MSVALIANLLVSVTRIDWASGLKGRRTDALVRATLRDSKARVWASVHNQGDLFLKREKRGRQIPA